MADAKIPKLEVDNVRTSDLVERLNMLTDIMVDHTKLLESMTKTIAEMATQLEKQQKRIRSLSARPTRPTVYR